MAPSKRSTHFLRLITSLLLFLLLNASLSIGLIYSIRRAGLSASSRNSLRTVAVQQVTRLHPTVLMSREIEAALLSRNYQQVANLVREAPAEALYSYSPTTLGQHFIHMSIWDTEALDALIQSSHVDTNRNCILHNAVRAFQGDPSHLEYIDALLTRHGADINLPDSVGFPPLAYAIQRGSLPTVEALLTRSAKVNISFAAHDSFLHYAVSLRATPGMISLLINHGGNPFYRGRDGLSPFHHSIFLTTSDRERIMDAFIHATHPNFTEPSHYRGKIVNFPISQERVRLPSSQTFYGYTPLHLAVEKIRSNRMVGILLSHGANRNKRENNGLTPLQLAEIIQQHDIIQTLGSQ